MLYAIEHFLREEKQKTYYIDLEDRRLLTILDEGVDSFVRHLQEEGITQTVGSLPIFVLIDEIHYLANPSSFLKLIADHHSSIKLIVSGLSSFDIKNKFQDSLAGRTVNFEVFNLSFKEFLLFKQYEFHKDAVFTEKKKDELKVLFKEYVLYGGYPKIVLTDEIEKKEIYLQQIIDTYIKKDIRDLAEIRDIDKFNKLLEVLASQSGNLLNMRELSNTCDIAFTTVERYLFLMENTYIIKLVHPYHHNIRSELFKNPKIYMYDSGLAHMLWLKELPKEILGNMFETSIFAELIKKYGKDNVRYWRTTDKKEIDFILKLKNAVFPIEAKLNFEQFNPTAINYFIKRYQAPAYKVVGLRGLPRRKEYVYPWNI